MKKLIFTLGLILMSTGVFAQYESLFSSSIILLREPVGGCQSLQEWVCKNTKIPSDVGVAWKYGEVGLSIKVNPDDGSVTATNINVRMCHESLIRAVMVSLSNAPAVKLREGLEYGKSYSIIFPVMPDGFRLCDNSRVVTQAAYKDFPPGDYSALENEIAMKAMDRESKYDVSALVPVLNKVFKQDKNAVSKLTSDQKKALKVQPSYEKMLSSLNPQSIIGSVSQSWVRLILFVDETGAIDIDKNNDFAFINLSYAASSTAFHFLKELNPKFTPAKDKDGNPIASNVLLQVIYHGNDSGKLASQPLDKVITRTTTVVRRDVTTGTVTSRSSSGMQSGRIAF